MKGKGKHIALVAGIVVVIWAVCLYYGYLYKNARNITAEQTAFNVEARQIAREYANDPGKADKKYLNKTIEIKGLVTKVADSVMTLDSLVFCSFDHLADGKSLNKAVTIKGRCIGYDELFSEVKLDQCSIKE